MLRRPGALIVGYVTLGAGQIERATLQKSGRRNKPDPLPAALLGQLAVHRDRQGRGYARSLLLFALGTALRASRDVASWASLLILSMTPCARSMSGMGFRTCHMILGGLWSCACRIWKKAGLRPPDFWRARKVADVVRKKYRCPYSSQGTRCGIDDAARLDNAVCNQLIKYIAVRHLLGRQVSEKSKCFPNFQSCKRGSVPLMRAKKFHKALISLSKFRRIAPYAIFRVAFSH